MTEAQACYDEVANEIDIDICGNCLKELTDSTHQFKVLTEVKTLPDGSDVIEDIGITCLESERIECESCGETRLKKGAKQDKNKWWLCPNCVIAEGLS